MEFGGLCVTNYGMTKTQLLFVHLWGSHREWFFSCLKYDYLNNRITTSLLYIFTRHFLSFEYTLSNKNVILNIDNNFDQNFFYDLFNKLKKK